MTSDEKSPKVLNATVVRLGLVSLFADISSEMLYPITPIFLTTVLGASMFSVGLIEGVAEGVASLLKTYSGKWSDQLQKRKTFIWLGYLLSALAKPLIGAAGSWGQVLSARVVDRFGKGIRSSPRDALLAEAVPFSLRGAAFGWHRGMDTLGAAIGPLLALVFLNMTSQDLRSLYYWALIPGVLAVIVALTIQEEKKRTTEPPKKIVVSLKLFKPKFKSYIFAWTLFSLANSSDVFLLLKAQKSGLSLTKTVVLYAFYNLLYSLASPYLGRLSDKMGRRVVLISGLSVFAIVYLFFGYATSEWHFWLLFGVYGIYMAATDGVGKAYAVDLIDPSLKATGLGVLGTATGLATIFASSVAGFIWDHFGASYTFIYGACGAALAILILSFIKEESVQAS
ncbi:MFS transporter [Bdellovibrio sp.]|uniref:MFS transporter n=1 Tax=Bdellovibrio sp. TaxID=28201 RepID=UPI0039E6831C